ncbi:hypothetical protein [Rhodococcus sp. SGAir0479]|uniref:hypothetical protein n=1 Tax=Rhodococcus sp. SGAir0479 TaxID=2567884 RepID=UPI0010CCBEBF|nr:hypothetical protein [Rhodococcus sp. SGAir0479]QCQ89925.1 hypothetical protein E7742_01010 [Rhodococcus sp. SGAir0479]
MPITGLAVAAVLLLGACGSDGVPDDRTGPQGPAATTDVMPQHDEHDDHEHPPRATQGYDPQRLAEFVAAFRAQYPQFAVGRDDDDIADIAIESCDDLANNVDERVVTAHIVDRAEHDGVVPTPEQARTIHGLTGAVCS